MQNELNQDQNKGATFAKATQLEQWLEKHHESETELWVRIYKKKSGVPSVTWDECVIASLIWGWIDGQKRSLDDASYLQRLSSRRPRSAWSKRNITLVETLISECRMKPAGLAKVQLAKENGQWENAYAGSADMVIPDDFLSALDVNPRAKARYETLPRSKLYEIYTALKSARREETRSRRMAKIIENLAQEG